MSLTVPHAENFLTPVAPLEDSEILKNWTDTHQNEVSLLEVFHDKLLPSCSYDSLFSDHYEISPPSLLKYTQHRHQSNKFNQLCIDTSETITPQKYFTL